MCALHHAHQNPYSFSEERPRINSILFCTREFHLVYIAADVVYVLHAFQKKSKRGIKIPQRELDLIKARLRRAEEDYQQWRKMQEE